MGWKNSGSYGLPELGLFRERFEAGVENLDVYFGSGHGGSCFSQPDFCLKKFAFQLREFLDISEGVGAGRAIGP